ncbi:collagenase [Massilia sp. W12]|uniref:M9 family metallopeptidase n=1 Tax=Massilia sp. W12 TaxID=3126507 RepID=UPI0030D35FA6
MYQHHITLAGKGSLLSSALLLALSNLSAAAVSTEAAHSAAPVSVADAHLEFGAAHSGKLKQAPQPRTPQTLPPSLEQIKYGVDASKKARTDLLPQAKSQQLAAQFANPCEDMNKLASHSGEALADYLLALPDYECHYGLFSLPASQAAKVFAPANFSAVARRFALEAGKYDASNIKLVNLIIYLRAGYYLWSGNVIAKPADSVRDTLRPALWNLIHNPNLYKQNTNGQSTAKEVFTMITNINDENYYLPAMKSVFKRFTNTADNPNASESLKQYSAAGALTGALTVMFYAHYRSDAAATLKNDASYPQTLYDFVQKNRAKLLGTSLEYQLTDAEREAFRFMQYPSQSATVKPMIKQVLASSSMTGTDSGLWLGAASSVTYYDNANCAEYGVCHFQSKLADAVLKHKHSCSPTIRIRAQAMTAQQLADSCAALAQQESYVHKMLQTKNKPVANDNNSALELVVFDDYENYSKYASVIYDIDTNNGGMYLEGDPSKAGNQARFIAHEASWLRPSFKIWNLEHEYVHYLDGRFNMAGDFAASTAKPTVWWIEGIAEYMSLKNNNQASIDAAKSGTYKLSTIFGNTYSMSDYTARAYRWGYMAARFMNEKHRADMDQVLAKFRSGDYKGYQTYMENIGTKYDAEFAVWVKNASTAGTPPEPSEPKPNLPTCSTAANLYLGKNCSISGFASSTQTYAYINLPAGAKNLRIFTNGGSGDVDLYISPDHYPSKTAAAYRSTDAGNQESVSIAAPQARIWYYIMLDAKKPFANVSISATYE